MFFVRWQKNTIYGICNTIYFVSMVEFPSVFRKEFLCRFPAVSSHWYLLPIARFSVKHAFIYSHRPAVNSKQLQAILQRGFHYLFEWRCKEMQYPFMSNTPAVKSNGVKQSEVMHWREKRQWMALLKISITENQCQLKKIKNVLCAGKANKEPRTLTSNCREARQMQHHPPGSNPCTIHIQMS